MIRIRSLLTVASTLPFLGSLFAQDFKAGDMLPTEVHPNVVVYGDFNRDGVPDIVVAEWTHPWVTVYLGDGHGGFLPHTNYSMGRATGPRFALAADFNGDGFLDIVTPDSNSADVTVLLGDGAGGFGTAHSFPIAGTTPMYLQAADLNGDGKLDLVVTGSASGNFTVLFGDGAGAFTFGSVVSVISPTSSPRGISIADFNNDGILDVATANFGANNVTVFHGDGAGNFVLGQTIPVGTNPFYMGAGDFNGDGRTDLAVPNFGDGTVSLLFGHPTAGLVPGGTLPVGESPRSVIAKDINLDGKLDLAIANYGANSVSIYHGDGFGGFTSQGTVGVGFGPYNIMVEDVNSDGLKDIVSADRDGFTMSILQGLPSQDFFAPRVFDVGTGPRGVASGDVDGDGKADLVVTNYYSNTISVLKGQGNGRFTTIGTYPVDVAPWGVLVADVTGDGKADILVGSSSKNNVAILRGDGLGGFVALAKYNVSGEPRSIAVGDFNADGKVDIVTANYSGSASVLLGTGAGSFAPFVSYPTGTGSQSVSVADMNADGKLDLVVCNGTAGTVSVLLGTGTGTFGTAASAAAGTAPATTAVGDFDHDGKLDVAVSNETVNTLTVLRGNGAGGFLSSVTLPAGLRPVGLAAADMNGDTIPDLVAANATSSTVTVHLSNGNGTFQDPVVLPAGNYSRAVVLADFDNDSRTDIAVANTNGNDVWAILNLSGTIPNRPPVANAQSVSVEQGQSIAITLTGYDPDNTAVTFSLQTPPTHGTLTGTVPNLTYTANASYTGPDSLVFSVSDGSLSTNGTVSINVTRINHAPTATPQTVSTNEDTAVTVALTGTDPDSDPLTFHMVTPPAHGIVSGSSPNFVYTPAANYNGSDSFTFAAFDGFANSAPATVTLNIAAVNDAPYVATVIPNQTIGGTTTTVSLDLSATFADYESPTASLVLSVVGSTNPTLVAPSISGTTLTLQLDPNNGGTATVTVRATDPQGAGGNASFNVTVLRPAHLTISDASEGEGGRDITFTLTLSSPSNVPVTVNYATADLTATAGLDYTAASGTVTFPVGATTRTIAIKSLADVIDEDDETFRVLLSNASGAIIDRAEAIGTILDNDSVTINVTDITVTEGNSGTTAATYTVTLSNPSVREVRVNYATVDVAGSAVAGVDYVAKSGVLIFAPGTTSQTVTVDVIADTMDEVNETFNLVLSNPVNATATTRPARCTIVDDDDPPTLIVDNPTIAEGNSGTRVLNFTATLSSPSGIRSRVQYATVNGTATAGSDYVAKTGEIVFDPGVTSRTISIVINGDTVVEGNETFSLSLTTNTPTAITLPTVMPVGTITNDD